MVPTVLVILYLSALQPTQTSAVEKSGCYNANTGLEDPCVPVQMCTHLQYWQTSQHLVPCGTEPTDKRVCCREGLTFTSSHARTDREVKRLVGRPSKLPVKRQDTNQTSATTPATVADPIADPIADPVAVPDSPLALTRNHPKVALLAMKGCGLSSVNLIVQGSRAAREQFPWMARLCYVNAVSGLHVCGCGASVISKRYLLSASHCVLNLPDRFELVSAVVGEYDDSTDPDCDSPRVCSPPAQSIPIERATAHPCYDETRMVNDVALIRLARDIDLSSDAVTPICLPFEDLQYKNLNDVFRFFVAGWGLTENGSSSSVLRFTGVPPFSNGACAEVYKGEEVCIAPSVLCAGGLPQDSCNGDSGGPLMMLDTVRYADGEASTRVVQAGIVSYGASVCGLPGVPAVYTRVGFHLEWILSTMEP